MRHSALARFARKRDNPSLDGSLRNILLFLIFQILQSSATIISILMDGIDRLIIESQFLIFS